MLNLNENRSSSPALTLSTDITSDQEGTINKNSIVSETEQSLQGSLVDNQDSLNDYVDANSTPMYEKINNTIQVADDNEVTSGNKGNRSVVSSDSTPLSEGSVNEQEDVTESKKGKRSASEILQQSKQQLKEKDEEITALKAQQNTQEVTDLKTKTSQVQQLTQKNKELEAKNKTTEQPKQGNGARYTATVGVGLAAGLIAFTALEHTVRLEMLVIIGIAVASALVAGGITYAALPSTQVDGAKAQEVDGNNKGK